MSFLEIFKDPALKVAPSVTYHCKDWSLFPFAGKISRERTFIERMFNMSSKVRHHKS